MTLQNGIANPVTRECPHAKTLGFLRRGPGFSGVDHWQRGDMPWENYISIYCSSTGSTLAPVVGRPTETLKAS